MKKINLIKSFFLGGLFLIFQSGYAQVENVQPNDAVNSMSGSNNVNAPDHANGAIITPNGSDPATRGPDQSNALSTPSPTVRP